MSPSQVLPKIELSPWLLSVSNASKLLSGNNMILLLLLMQQLPMKNYGDCKIITINSVNARAIAKAPSFALLIGIRNLLISVLFLFDLSVDSIAAADIAQPMNSVTASYAVATIAIITMIVTTTTLLFAIMLP